MLSKKQIKSKIVILLLFSLLNLFASAQTDINSIHEYDLVEMNIEGKIIGGSRNEYLFLEQDSVLVNISKNILIKGLFDTLLQMKLFESKNGISITPEKGYMENSTGLQGETLLYNITINQIYHRQAENFPSSVANVNPKLTRFSDFVQGFGLLIAIVLSTVLFKAIFDYIKIRNQLKLIIR